MCNKFNIRKNKLNIIKNEKNFYRNNFSINYTIKDIVIKYSHIDRDLLLNNDEKIITAGRIILRRKIGKVIFITLQDIFSYIQLYLSYNFLINFNFINLIDIGDLIGIEGNIFKTKTNELSINCLNIYLLNKSLRELPDKFKGLKNIEYRSKKRYIDLISNKNSRDVFILRSDIILEIRKYLTFNKFIEVETPIMQNIPGGANANPFKTKYNYFDNIFYLRISPELYLKKLIISGFNKIFEIGKSFRNEGISKIHNPEFTILELYCSYTNYLYLIKFIQNLIRNICIKIFNTEYIKYNNVILNFKKNFDIFTMKDSICRFNNLYNLNIDKIDDCYLLSKKLNLKIENNFSIGKIQFEIFKKTVEKKLIQPTFITEYPIDISPLSKRNDFNKNIADRFELFINGIEISNGFSELNDSDDQKNRFLDQISNNYKNNNFYDNDYINALEYGLPPTSGLGIGIDRLIMLLTNSKNIKDVIFFPTLRYKKNS